MGPRGRGLTGLPRWGPGVDGLSVMGVSVGRGGEERTRIRCVGLSSKHVGLGVVVQRPYRDIKSLFVLPGGVPRPSKSTYMF